MRFPKGRATERVVSDILQIADGMKQRGPIPLSPPITGAVIVDALESPVPDMQSAELQSSELDARMSQPMQGGMPGNNLERGVAKGSDMVDLL